MIQLTKDYFFEKIKPRDPDTHKGSYGTLTVVAGSSLFRGAPALASVGALRTGCGIVRVASTERVISSVASKLDECIYLPLDENQSGGISFSSIRTLLQASVKSTAVLAGCGMTCSEDTKSIVSVLLSELGSRIILDADALNSICDTPKILLSANSSVTLTPHIGEMVRLLKGAKNTATAEEIKNNPIKFALEFAKEFNCTVVLKDHVTHIASPDGRIAKNSNGNAGLARGGSGDLLAGMISSFNAQGFDPFDAACLGVWLHAEAADLCAAERSKIAMLPSDIPEYICKILCREGR